MLQLFNCFFSLYAACGCNVTGSTGSTCDQLSGVCTCKPNVVGDKCDTCMPGYYHEDPTSSAGCQPCNCNIGGALSTECDMFSGQCYCRAGVTGRACSETTSGYFFPAIDHIRREGENAGGISSPFIRTSGENTLFTGTGYYRVIDLVSIANFRPVIPPASGTYEATFRYNLQGAMAWNSATLSIVTAARAQEGTGPSDCDELPIGTSTIQYGPWTLGIGTISRSICLRGGRSYTFTLQNFNSGQTVAPPTLDIDSLVVILTTSSSLQVFSDTTLAAQYSSCVISWRSLITQSTADPSCEQVTFAVSTELYNGTRCKFSMCHIFRV